MTNRMSEREMDAKETYKAGSVRDRAISTEASDKLLIADAVLKELRLNLAMATAETRDFHAQRFWLKLQPFLQEDQRYWVRRRLEEILNVKISKLFDDDLAVGLELQVQDFLKLEKLAPLTLEIEERSAIQRGDRRFETDVTVNDELRLVEDSIFKRNVKIAAMRSVFVPCEDGAFVSDNNASKAPVVSVETGSATFEKIQELRNNRRDAPAQKIDYDLREASRNDLEFAENCLNGASGADSALYGEMDTPEVTLAQTAAVMPADASFAPTDRNGNVMSAGEIDEPAGKSDGPASEQFEQQGEGVGGDYPVDEERLSLEGFSDRTGRVVILLRELIGELREMFKDGR